MEVSGREVGLVREKACGRGERRRGLKAWRPSEQALLFAARANEFGESGGATVEQVVVWLDDVTDRNQHWPISSTGTTDTHSPVIPTRLARRIGPQWRAPPKNRHSVRLSSVNRKTAPGGRGGYVLRPQPPGTRHSPPTFGLSASRRQSVVNGVCTEGYGVPVVRDLIAAAGSRTEVDDVLVRVAHAVDVVTVRVLAIR